MYGTEFRQSQGQIAIGLETVLEDLDVPRTIHGLDGEDALVVSLVAGRGSLEHAFAKPAPMARGLPQGFIEQLWCVDFLVVALQPPPHVGDDLLEDRPAVGMPEHRARALFLEVEEA